MASVARGDVDAVLQDPIVALAAHVARERRSDRFTRFDGNVAAAAELIPVPGPISASRLQTYAKCPHRFLLEHVLHVDVAEEPERLIVIDALTKGSLVHEILERFVLAGLGRGAWHDGDRVGLLAIADEVFTRYEDMGLTGRGLYWTRDSGRITEDLHRFVDRDNERMAEHGLVALAAEHEFRDVEVTLPNGRVLSIRGSIDRVDRQPDEGWLHVLDYKTGKVGKNHRALATNPHDGGQLLQLYLYAKAARATWGDVEVRADYWFPTTVGGFKLHGYEVTPEIEADVERALTVIVDGIAAGAFPARPAEKPGYTWVDCHFCAPDGGSDRDLRRSWERKRLDPALTAYAALSEGVTDDDAA